MANPAWSPATAKRKSDCANRRTHPPQRLNPSETPERRRTGVIGLLPVARLLQPACCGPLLIVRIPNVRSLNACFPMPFARLKDRED